MQTCLLTLLLALGTFAPAGAQVLLYDDFEDGDASAWLAFVSGWHEADGVFHATDTRPDIPVEVVYPAGLLWTDYSVEVDVTPLSQHFPVATGLYLRWNQPTVQPDRSFAACELLVGTANGVVGRWLRLWAADGQQAEFGYAPFTWSPGNTYRLRATTVGPALSCEVVGQPGTRIELASHLVRPAGTVALRSTHIRSDFDNLLVEAIETCHFGPAGGPRSFTRGTGKPVVETLAWDSCGGDGTLVVRATAVASAFVWLNGQAVLQPSDFHGHDTTLEIPVTLLEGANTLAIELRGRPGSQLEVDLTE